MNVSPQRHAHPWAFMLLAVPFGTVSGYVSVTVAYQLRQAGVSVSAIAGIVALTLLPHTWKVLWAPITDATLTQKRWYLLSGVATAAGVAAIGWIPTTSAGLGALGITVFVASLATTFMGMSIESLIAHSTPDHLKGRAAGWFQAGVLGGGGVGGGLGLWLAERTAERWMPSAIVAVLCLGCCAALLAVPSPERTHAKGRILERLGAVGRDLWTLARERAGVLVLFLMFLPVGSGAAGGLWSAVADEWGASADVVALVTGTLNGIISAVGCIAGGWLCDRMSRRTAYVLYGLLQAACAVAMAFTARTPGMFIAATLAYAFITGLTYAGYSAVVLDVIGKGAAATKYSVYASLANMPIAYMTLIDGEAHDRWGSRGLLLTEAAMCTAGAVLFMVLASVLLRGRRRAATEMAA